MSENKPIKILFFIPSFSSGGAEAFIVNVIENLDRTKYVPSLLCIDSTESIYEERLNKVGITIDTLINDTISNPIKRYFLAYKLFKAFIKSKKNEFDVIHYNIAQGEDLPFIAIAKKAGIGVRILHSHNSSVNSKYKYYGHLFFKLIYNNVATTFFACSNLAAEWLLPKKVLMNNSYKIIKNGIDVDKYAFDCADRISKRRELQIEDKIALLNVGRLNNQKNQSFLIDVFKEVSDVKPNVVLYIAGEGDLRTLLEKKTKDLGLTDKIVWMENRNDIPELYSAFDVFLLPSLFEGLPFTIIEAQASGIFSIISNTISDECIITDRIIRAPLDVNAFSQVLLKTIDNEATYNREKDYSSIVANSGFDINLTVNDLAKYYNPNGLKD